MDDAEKYAAALRWVLREKGKRESLAASAGVTAGYISNVAHRRRDGRMETKQRIALAAGYSYEDFLALGERVEQGFSSRASFTGQSEMRAEAEVRRGLTTRPPTKPGDPSRPQGHLERLFVEWLEEDVFASQLLAFKLYEVLRREFPSFKRRTEEAEKRAGGGCELVPVPHQDKSANG